MSADLTWQIIRKNDRLIRRQKGIQKHFSVELFNIRGINSKSFNAMDIAPPKDGKGIVVSLKVPRKSGMPAKNVRSITLRNTDKMLRSTKTIAKSQGMTPLNKLAQRRAAVIVRSQQPKSKKHSKKIEA
ncbi:unnamed protein product [Heligmosomoides polygyrus]|uniref:Large ribosomal subunit protein eL28 n=1 Tax=Heligmosomoides polygyrus TaxID=6339 RepID=A0A183GS08_HELPZ|nr:unnamed protein product [Heligmosomoides polygyrus]